MENDKELIGKILNIEQPMSNNPTRISGVVTNLKAARKLFGCDIETGEYKKHEMNVEIAGSGLNHSFQYTSLINYLIFLEQIGSIFKLSDGPDPNNLGGIKYALATFAWDRSLGKQSLNAIVSLRNSLTHSFGLATEDKRSEKDNSKYPPRKFILSLERNEDVVTLPVKEWEGAFDDKSQDTYTTIHILDFVELCEYVYRQVLIESENNNLGLKISPSEVKMRYTVTY